MVMASASGAPLPIESEDEQDNETKISMLTILIFAIESGSNSCFVQYLRRSRHTESECLFRPVESRRVGWGVYTVASALSYVRSS